MGNLAMQRTKKRAERKGKIKRFAKEMMDRYDKDNNGSLDRKEVEKMAKGLLTKFTPEVGGITDEDIDMIMRLGGDTCKTEIRYKDIPEALAMIQLVREENKHVSQIFDRHDKDGTGSLDAGQLKAVLKETYCFEPSDNDIEYILKQCEPRGKADPIDKDELKAALTCWYFVHSTAESESIKEVFRTWDSNNSGVIEKEQLIDVLSKLPPTNSKSREELAEIFKEIDLNNDGKIQYEEFVDWITGDSGSVPTTVNLS